MSSRVNFPLRTDTVCAIRYTSGAKSFRVYEILISRTVIIGKAGRGLHAIFRARRARRTVFAIGDGLSVHANKVLRAIDASRRAKRAFMVRVSTMAVVCATGRDDSKIIRSLCVWIATLRLPFTDGDNELPLVDGVLPNGSYIHPYYMSAWQVEDFVWGVESLCYNSTSTCSDRTLDTILPFRPNETYFRYGVTTSSTEVIGGTLSTLEEQLETYQNDIVNIPGSMQLAEICAKSDYKLDTTQGVCMSSLTPMDELWRRLEVGKSVGLRRHSQGTFSSRP